MQVIPEGVEESSDEDLPEEHSDDPGADYNFYPVCISVDKIFQSQRRNMNCTKLLKENSMTNLAQMMPSDFGSNSVRILVQVMLFYKKQRTNPYSDDPRDG